MSRRPLTLLALAIASFVLTACSSMTAPRRDDVEDYSIAAADCAARGGVWNGGARTCE